MFAGIRDLFTRARERLPDLVASFVPAFLTNVVWLIDPIFASLARRAYGSNALVYSCLRLLAQSVPEAPLVPYRAGQAGDLEKLDVAHPLYRLIERPNELMTQYEFWELTEIYLGLVGRAHWWKQRDGTRQTVALWPLRPDRVSPLYSASNTDGERVLWGWAYHEPGSAKPISVPRSEIMTFNLPAPGGETGGIVEGLGPCQVLAREISADNEATSFVGLLLKNYAQPSFVLKVKRRLANKLEARRLKENFIRDFSDSHRGEPALLDAEAEIEKLSFDLQQLEFPALRANAETRVAAVFGVPPILVGLKAGLDRATYSNVEQARQFFAETTLSTRWRRYSDQFTNDIAVEFGEDVVCRFDTSNVRALSAQRAEAALPIAEGFKLGSVTRNEYRVRVLGLEALEGGDVFYIPSNVIPTPVPGAEQSAAPARSLRGTPGSFDGTDAVEVVQEILRLAKQSATHENIQRRADSDKDRLSEDILPKLPDI